MVFTGIGSCLLTGSQSGEVYYFSSDQPERSIDSQDAAELLSSGLSAWLLDPEAPQPESPPA